MKFPGQIFIKKKANSNFGGLPIVQYFSKPFLIKPNPSFSSLLRKSVHKCPKDVSKKLTNNYSN